MLKNYRSSEFLSLKEVAEVVYEEVSGSVYYSIKNRHGHGYDSFRSANEVSIALRSKIRVAVKKESGSIFANFDLEKVFQEKHKAEIGREL